MIWEVTENSLENCLHLDKRTQIKQSRESPSSWYDKPNKTNCLGYDMRSHIEQSWFPLPRYDKSQRTIIGTTCTLIQKTKPYTTVIGSASPWYERPQWIGMGTISTMTWEVTTDKDLNWSCCVKIWQVAKNSHGKYLHHQLKTVMGCCFHHDMETTYIELNCHSYENSAQHDMRNHIKQSWELPPPWWESTQNSDGNCSTMKLHKTVRWWELPSQFYEKPRRTLIIGTAYTIS